MGTLHLRSRASEDASNPALADAPYDASVRVSQISRPPWRDCSEEPHERIADGRRALEVDLADLRGHERAQLR